MEVLMAIVTGVLFGVGIHFLQQRSMLRLIFGVTALGHATNFVLITLGRLKRGSAPILTEAAPAYTDPVPHALILTAIVIGFGVTGFSLALAYRAYQEVGTDDMDQLREPDDLVVPDGERAKREVTVHEQ